MANTAEQAATHLGQRVVRKEDAALVSGTALFADDYPVRRDTLQGSGVSLTGGSLRTLRSTTDESTLQGAGTSSAWACSVLLTEPALASKTYNCS